MRNPFCTHCGAAHVVEAYPRACDACSGITYQNPLPVAVLVQEVLDAPGRRRGVLVGRRTIEPCKGQWGLIGGFMNPDDPSFAHAAVRELFEETGIVVSVDDIVPTHSVCIGVHVLVFHINLNVSLTPASLDAFVPNDECDAVRIAWEPEELCFPTHTAALKRWFENY